MALPASFLDELRARLPLSAYIGRYVKLAHAGREMRGCCPFHNEKTASFYVNDQKSFYHCFGCGAHGDLIGFAMRNNRWEFPEAIENLAREAGIDVPVQRREPQEQIDARTRLYAVCDAVCEFFTSQLYGPNGRQALTYLKQRGLEDDTIAAWRLGYSPEDAQALLKFAGARGFTERELEQVGLWRKRDEGNGGYSFFRGRVMFPVMDKRGRPVAFGARLMAGEGPKYINSPEHMLFKKGEMLFGADKAGQMKTDQPLLLVEGYMDVISLWQAGFAAVAPLGTALTEPQTLNLWTLGRRSTRPIPVLCFDGDNAGYRAAARALRVALPNLAPERTLQFCFLPQGEDPDSLVKNRGAAAFVQVLEQASSLIDVMWRNTTEGQPHDTPESRATLEHALREQTDQIKDPAVKGHYERDIKNRLWQLFNPRRTFSGKGGQQGGQNQKTATIHRLPPAPPALMRERVALALLINYPEIYPVAESWLLAHEPLNASFAPVCNALIKAPEILGDRLDAEGLARYLEEECGGAALSDLLSETTYQHAGFARPGRTLAGAQGAWQEISAQLAVARMQDDLQAAQREFAETMSEDAYQRMLALQAELATLPEILEQVLNESTMTGSIK